MNKKSDEAIDATPPRCGIVMPISSIDGCDERHWIDVQFILKEAITDAGFDPNLVSHADEVGVIHKRIIENLYSNPIVVVDISAKNPNVMFELGLRLAFDKPTILIKDDKTSYNFDTSPIEHLNYPRDLRFTQILEFKAELTNKIKTTYDASTKSADYTTFLKHFGTFKVAKINTAEVPVDEFVLQQLEDIQSQLKSLSVQNKRSVYTSEESSLDREIERAIKEYAYEKKIPLFSLLKFVPVLMNELKSDPRINRYIYGSEKQLYERVKEVIRGLEIKG